MELYFRRTVVLVWFLRCVLIRTCVIHGNEPFTMVLTGMCNGCGHEHVRPWGSYCKYLKRAVEKCKELHVSELDFKYHIDLDTMAADTAHALEDTKAVFKPVGTTDPTGDSSTIDQATVDKLLDITKQQRSQIDDLIQQFKNFSTHNMVSPPASAGAHKSGSEVNRPGLSPAPLRPSVPDPYSTTPATTLGHGQSVPDHTADVPHASDLVVGPLTAALSKLSDMIDPSTAIKSKGILLRPEYYVQHKANGVAIRNLDHSKMNFRDLCYGMDCILVHLLKTGGDAINYASHKLFVSTQAKSGRFVDRALVDYDRHVMDKFIEGESSSFIVGDLLGVALYFHGGNTLPRQSESKLPRSKRNRRQKDEGEGGVPDDFPEHICYGFNYGKCTGTCSKQHICRICIAKHKAVGCPDRKSDKKD